MKPQDTLEEEFEQFMRVGWPHVHRDSPQWRAQRLCFFAGMTILLMQISVMHDEPDLVQQMRYVELVEEVQNIMASMDVLKKEES